MLILKWYGVRCEMSLNISKKVLLFFFLSLFYFLPLDNVFFSLVRNGLFALAIIQIFIAKKRPSRFIVLIAGYYFMLHLITASNGNFYLNDIILNIKVVVYIWYLNNLCDSHPKGTLKCFWWIIFTLCVSNFLSVLIFPKGIYVTESFIDIWHGYYSVSNWIFGNKNTQTCWYLLLVLLSHLSMTINRKWNYLLTIFIAVISVCNMILIDSSTSIFVLGMAAIGLLISYRNNRRFKFNINTHFIMVAYLAINFLVVTGSAFFLEPLVQTLFEKDLNFSGRGSVVWPAVFLFISQKPIFGQGIIDASKAGELMQNVALVNAHNQILQILWQGGIVQFSYVAVIFSRIARSINRIEKKQFKLFICIVLCAFLIDTIFEVVSSGYIFIILLYMINKSSELLDKTHGLGGLYQNEQ